MSLPIENSMTLSALQELVPQHKMDEAFERYGVEERTKYSAAAKGLFDLACDVLPQRKSINAVLMYTGLATPSGNISKKGRRFLWIAYVGRL